MYVYMCLFPYVYMYLCTSWCTCETQKTVMGVGSLHPTMWAPVIQLRLSGLVESPLLSSHLTRPFLLTFLRQNFMHPR